MAAKIHGVACVITDLGDEVPILAELIALTSRILAALESMEASDAYARSVKIDMDRANSTLGRFDGMKVNKDVMSKLEQLKLLMLEISEHVAKWANKSTMKKMWNNKSYRDKFEQDRALLAACLDALSRSIQVDTNLGVKEMRLAQEDVLRLAEENNKKRAADGKGGGEGAEAAAEKKRKQEAAAALEEAKREVKRRQAEWASRHPKRSLLSRMLTSCALRMSCSMGKLVDAAERGDAKKGES
ncbi:hypothetical protein TeGR_g15091 [Tetraparma gracilis]|uniref:Fungal N-terminal domain-containing protein n=1 Tax=Tetraparma gracilis TaxID=2962635 RepID=A0ABQ6M3E5_9STRA|nr:hypothetical protein TeGR_g15091 [Tetraparma gracilis]